MEFPFPPLPPEYGRVLTARWLCLVWTLLALAWLMSKFVRTKAIRGTDAWAWVGLLVVAALLSCAGFGWYVHNDWLVPLMLTNMAIGVPFTGLILTLFCHGRQARVRDIAFAIGVSLFCVTMAQPATVAQSRESARRTQCKNQLKQIGVAFHNFEERHEQLPPVVREEPPVSWRVSILPYLDQAPLYAQYDLGSVWDRPPNEALASQQMRGYVCLSSSRPQDEQGRWFTAYSMPTGPQTVGSHLKGMRIRDITDGTSNTLLVVEACGSQIVWTKPTALHGYSFWPFQHEPCLMGWKKGHKPRHDGDNSHTITSVWAVSWEGKNRIVGNEHPTQKPVELFARPFRKHTLAGEIGFEPFGGSGSQVSAAEQLDRLCYAIEIEPCFCDVIVERWQKLTGKKARRRASP